jgi:hypothetical protein
MCEDRRGRSRSETYHFEKWGHEVSANVACPMVRADKGRGRFQDYYVYEPAVAVVGNHTCAVMPTRWFSRGGKVFARALPMIRMQWQEKPGYVVDGTSSHEIPLSDFRFSVPLFEQHHSQWNVPDPKNIEGDICLLLDMNID